VKSKPDYCFNSGCPLAVLCGGTFKKGGKLQVCNHHFGFHPEDGHCTVVDDEGVLCECPGFQSKGKGFVLGVGDPEKASLAVVLEAPGAEEISFPLDGPGAPGIIPPDELERRKREYAELGDSRFIRVGAPVVGKSGSLLNQWIFPKVGVRREEVFIDNTLRCLPPKNKQGQPYPTGAERSQAEHCCRHWDRVQRFDARMVEVSLHPAGILREVTPLPLLIRDFEKAVSAIRQGYKTLMLLGGKAAETFLGYAENVTRWRGHYEVLTEGVGGWYDRVVARVEGKLKKGKKQKKVGKAEAINRAVDGMEDILETPSMKLPKVRRKRKSVKQ